MTNPSTDNDMTNPDVLTFIATCVVIGCLFGRHASMHE
jgi:hypothetical protein